MCCSPYLLRQMSLDCRSLPGLALVNAGVATKPPSLPRFARMQPPPALNHPALHSCIWRHCCTVDLPGAAFKQNSNRVKCMSMRIEELSRW
jgi:hypothetical protein